MTDLLGSLDLTSGGYSVESAAYPSPEASTLVAVPSAGDAARVVGGGPEDLRRISYHIVIEGADTDDVNAKWAALVAACPSAREGRSVDLLTGDLGDTYPVTFTLRDTVAIVAGEGGERQHQHGLAAWADVYVTWLADRYAYGVEQTLTAAAYNAPCLIDLAALGMLGDVAAPLEVTLQSNGVNKLHSAYLGLLPADCAWTGYVAEAESLSWAGGTPAAGPAAAAHGGASEKNSAATDASASVADTDVPEGSYLALARALMENGADTGTLSAGGLAAVTFAGTTWALQELGELRLPSLRVRGGAASALPVTMKSSSAVAGHAVAADYYGLCPLSHGFVCWHHATPGSTVDRLHVGYDGTVYLEDVASYAAVTSDGPLIAHPRGKLVVFAEDGAGAVASEPLTVTLKVVPRHLLWATA